MFFSKKIKSIKKGDLVLEVGPGGSPYFRSDVLLEKKFDTEEEYAAQRGFYKKLKTNKKVVFYDGDKFPFEDDEFDYVICSHVLEHVDDVEFFISELSRVAKRGYIEFPTVYYDYLYNFKVHKNFLLKKDDSVVYMKKEESFLDSFLGVQNFFYKSLTFGNDQLVFYYKDIFFQGFEWFSNINIKRVSKVEDICFDLEDYNFNKGFFYLFKNFLFVYRFFAKILKLK